MPYARSLFSRKLVMRGERVYRIRARSVSIRAIVGGRWHIVHIQVGTMTSVSTLVSVRTNCYVRQEDACRLDRKVLKLSTAML